MGSIISTILVILGVSVRFDTVAAHGGTGFGFCIGGRHYTFAGFDSLAAARRAAPGAVRRVIAGRDRASAANREQMRRMMTIGSGIA